MNIRIAGSSTTAIMVAIRWFVFVFVELRQCFPSIGGRERRSASPTSIISRPIRRNQSGATEGHVERLALPYHLGGTGDSPEEIKGLRTDSAAVVSAATRGVPPARRVESVRAELRDLKLNPSVADHRKLELNPVKSDATLLGVRAQKINRDDAHNRAALRFARYAKDRSFTVTVKSTPGHGWRIRTFISEYNFANCGTT